MASKCLIGLSPNQDSTGKMRSTRHKALSFAKFFSSPDHNVSLCLLKDLSKPSAAIRRPKVVGIKKSQQWSIPTLETEVSSCPNEKW
jgi:hypothetical protein